MCNITANDPFHFSYSVLHTDTQKEAKHTVTFHGDRTRGRAIAEVMMQKHIIVDVQIFNHSPTPTYSIYTSRPDGSLISGYISSRPVDRDIGAIVIDYLEHFKFR